MLGGSLNGLASLDAIRARLADLARPDLRPLAERLRLAMIEDNRRGLLAGTDGAGRAMAPLASSTARRSGVHSPLLPNGESSPLIANYEARVEPSGAGLSVVAGWSPEPAGLRQSITGTEHQPARDPRGLRPEGQDDIRRALDEFARLWIGGLL